MAPFSLVLQELPAHPKYKEVPQVEKDRARKVRYMYCINAFLIDVSHLYSYTIEIEKFDELLV